MTLTDTDTCNQCIHTTLTVIGTQHGFIVREIIRRAPLLVMAMHVRAVIAPRVSTPWVVGPVVVGRQPAVVDFAAAKHGIIVPLKPPCA